MAKGTHEWGWVSRPGADSHKDTKNGLVLETVGSYWKQF